MGWASRSGIRLGGLVVAAGLAIAPTPTTTTIASATSDAPTWETTDVSRPNLSPTEGDRAISIVRDRIEGTNGAAVLRQLDLRAILAYPADGRAFFARRIVYVSAHFRGAEPVYGAWVDLDADTSAAIVREWGSPSDTTPSSGRAASRDSGEQQHSEAARVAATSSVLLDLPPGRSVDWGNWTFDIEFTPLDEGMVVRNVAFTGHLIADKISFPAMLVRYANDACGPFVDRIGRPYEDIPWAANRTIAYREWTLDGSTWRELGVRKLIGDYDLFQSVILSPDGVLEALLAGSGLQCPADHVHWPIWMLNLDVDGGWSDVIVHGATGQRQSAEFDAAEDGTWRIEDADTGTSVKISPAQLHLDVPGDGLDGSTTGRFIGGRRYNLFDDVGWNRGFADGFPGLDDERLGADVAVWYRARMAHAATEGAGHWHTSGVRLAVTLGSPATATPLAAFSTAPSATHSARRLSD